MSLKLVLLSPNGTVYQNGQAKHVVLDELVILIQRLRAKGVEVALWSRHQTLINKTEPLQDYLARRSSSPVKLFLAASGVLPARQYAGSVDPVLKQVGVGRHEVILVGNGETDLRAGVNNALLLVRPEWYNTQLDYGFAVDSIRELARFCELFALRQHPIYWSIDQDSLQMRAMGPFSTIIPDFAAFGSDAKATAKYNAGERLFWFLMIVSTLYFSGLVHKVDYICPYPGHDAKSKSNVRKGLDEIMSTLSKCFRKTYLPELIVRHKPAIKSQGAKQTEKTFQNQLNTIHLNRRPGSYGGPARKTPLSLAGKRSLLWTIFAQMGEVLT